MNSSEGMDFKDMEMKKVLWLEDQYEDFSAFRSRLFIADYWVDCVRSASEAVEKLRNEQFLAAIFDIKVLPGEAQEWIDLDKQKRKENPDFDPNLGFELLKSIFTPNRAEVKVNPPIKLNPHKVIIFSVVYDKTDELSAMGIPADQIIYKANSDLDTLPKLIKKIEKNELENPIDNQSLI